MHWDIKLRTGLQLGIQLDNYWLIANWKEAPPHSPASKGRSRWKWRLVLSSVNHCMLWWIGTLYAMLCWDQFLLWMRVMSGVSLFWMLWVSVRFCNVQTIDGVFDVNHCLCWMTSVVCDQLFVWIGRSLQRMTSAFMWSVVCDCYVILWLWISDRLLWLQWMCFWDNGVRYTNALIRL